VQLVGIELVVDDLHPSKALDDVDLVEGFVDHDDGGDVHDDHRADGDGVAAGDRVHHDLGRRDDHDVPAGFGLGERPGVERPTGESRRLQRRSGEADDHRADHRLDL
jgi:hypothetical protein